MHAIEITGLAKTYKGKKRQKVNALKGLGLTINKGEVFGFLGPNGAGKSTTIKILTGQIKAQAGEAKILGQPATEPRARQDVGYLPENPAFFQFLTAREYLRTVCKLVDLEDQFAEEQVEAVIEKVGLTEAANRRIRGYSKGMVQRLAMAQALVHDPEVYILDEPMSGLDPAGRVLFKEIIQDLRTKGKTIFFSSHITADVEAVCDRVGIVAEGQLKAVDTVANILDRGVEGYTVVLQDKDGFQKEMSVSKDQLDAELEKVATSPTLQVKRVVPMQEGLEQFFLDTISGKTETTTERSE